MSSSLLSFLVRRSAAAALLILIVLSLTFFFIHLAPGDPTLVLQDPRLTGEQREAMRRAYGLDRPLAAQYLSWLTAVVFDADWGISYVHSRPVAEVIGEYALPTLLLTAAGLLVQFGVGLLAGVTAARHAGTSRDYLIRLTAMVLYSLPVFWTGLMALLLFSYNWSLFPPGHLQAVDAASLSPMGRTLDVLHHLALPALVLGLAAAGGTARFTRNSLLEELGEDYIRTARAKGLSESRIVWIHALRNAAAPILQLFGLSLPLLLSGALVVEVVFSWPGLGRLTFDSILSRDYPVVLATTALTGVLVVVGNLLVDLLHGVTDPRVRQ
ncbi:MAG: ABC transporter permease [Thermoanaerobaculia bacterium]|jgi:peptide/nickel transport system permease protein